MQIAQNIAPTLHASTARKKMRTLGYDANDSSNLQEIHFVHVA